MKSSLVPPSNAAAQVSMASCPLVRNTRSSGKPMTSDRAGSATCSAGIHCRAPISACPVPSRTYDRCTVVMPLATLPTHPRYCRLTPAVAPPCLAWLVSSIAPTRSPRRRPPRRAASSRPATANPRTTPIAAHVSQHARFSNRWVRCGDRSPTRCAIVHPFRFGSSLTRAATYLPACSHGSHPPETRTQQVQQLTTLPAAQGRAYPDGSSRFRFCCPHKHMIDRRLRLAQLSPTTLRSRSQPQRRLPY